jgi:hypothetical protein
MNINIKGGNLSEELEEAKLTIEKIAAKNISINE